MPVRIQTTKKSCYLLLKEKLDTFDDFLISYSDSSLFDTDRNNPNSWTTFLRVGDFNYLDKLKFSDTKKAVISNVFSKYEFEKISNGIDQAHLRGLCFVIIDNVPQQELLSDMITRFKNTGVELSDLWFSFDFIFPDPNNYDIAPDQITNAIMQGKRLINICDKLDINLKWFRGYNDVDVLNYYYEKELLELTEEMLSGYPTKWIEPGFNG